MRLLALSTWFPYPADNGSRLRAFHLLRELARQGHTLHVVAGAQADVTDAAPEPLTAFCETFEAVPWRWYDADGGGAGGLRALLSATPRSVAATPNPALTDAIRRRAEAVRPDAVLVMQQGMDGYVPDELFARLPLALEEVEVTGAERAFRRAGGLKERLRHGMTYGKGVRYWRRRMRRYRAVTAVSEPEARAVRRVVGGDRPPVHVVPNGVAAGDWTPRPGGGVVPGRLVYNGPLTYAPNREAVRWFAEEILPRVASRVPAAHLVVTGRHTEEQAREMARFERVRLTGFLPDLRPTLAGAALCVVPLRAGGGTRLKILEAWAAGVPVVSTPLGAAGLDGRDGEHLVLADDGEGFAEAVVSLLEQPARAEAVAASARALAERQYEWRAIAAGLSDVLEEVRAGWRR